MRIFRSLAIAAITFGVLAPPAIAHHINKAGCIDGFCYAFTRGATYDEVNMSYNGEIFSGRISCTAGRWTLHNGWRGNVTRQQAIKLSRAYCEKSYGN